jgi:hypothetical protein
MTTTSIRRTAFALVGVSLLASLVITAGSGFLRVPAALGAAHGGNRAPDWSRRLNTADKAGYCYEHAVVSSPDGSTVFVAGSFVAAFRSAAGRRLWARRGRTSVPRITISLDGRVLFLTGWMTYRSKKTNATVSAYRTSALDARTGDELWAALYKGPVAANDRAVGIGLSSDGRTVFVGGTASADVSGSDFVAIAYRAATGRRVWMSGFNGFNNAQDVATATALDPRLHAFFVSGYRLDTIQTSSGFRYVYQYETVAYDTRNGRVRWSATYRGPRSDPGQPEAVAVAPDGTRVFVTGSRPGSGPGSDYATVAYVAMTGKRMWVARYDGSAHREDDGYGVAVSGDGTTIVVTGRSMTQDSSFKYVTIAYAAKTGGERWLRTFDRSHPSQDAPGAGVLMNPNGKTVYVSGRRDQTPRGIGTVAYRVSDGAQRWAAQFAGSGASDNEASGMAAAPDGVRMFVAGAAGERGYSGPQCIVLAYRS